MSVLETIGAFGQGMAQGVGQGMDIYDRYQTIQDENQKRQKNQRVEARVKDLMDQGGFDDGPSGLEQTANFYLDEGDTENYLKYSQSAKQIRQADASRDGFNAFAVGQQDPVAGYELMNKMHQKMGDDVTYQVTQSPGGGYQVMSTVGGRTTATNYKDRDELEHSLLKNLEPTLFADAKDFGEYKKGQGELALAQAKTQGELAEQPYRIAEKQANVAQSYAAAGASSAQAGATQARLPGQIAEDQASVELKHAQAQEALTGKPSSVEDYVNKTTKVDPMSAEEIAYADRPIIRSQMGTLIQSANPQLNGAQAVTIGDTLMKSPTFKVNPQTGEAELPGGVTVKIGTAAIAQLAQARKLAEQPPE